MKRLLFAFVFLTGMALISCSSGGEGGGPTGGGETTLYDVKVSVTPGGAGTIAPSADSSYEEGETISLRAEASDAYLFSNWTGDVESTDNPVSLTVDQDYSLAAHFEKKNYELSIKTEGEGTVTERIVPQKSKEYEHGTVVELIAAPKEGYIFVEWKGAVTSNENPVQITVEEPKEVTAVFEKKNYALTVNTSGNGAVSEEVVTAKAKSYEHGTVVELTAKPATGYTFGEWQGAVTSTQNPVQVTVNSSKEVTAIFEPKRYTITVNSTGDGTVSVIPGQPEHAYGTTVSLFAESAEGWGFKKWQGDLSSTENPAQITINGPKEVTVVFGKLYLANNGVTIRCPDAAVGESGTVNGVTYTKRTSNQITPANAATTCTSGIRDMSSLFKNAASFNGDISSWDVSSVTDMSSMFFDATAFNQDISNWDVSNVTNMSAMFWEATSFNGDIGSWDVSKVIYMIDMFANATSFNADISGWNVSNVTNMLGMFTAAKFFNQDLSNWDVSSVTDMRHMFEGAESFNQDISNWDVSKVTDMRYMFAFATSFNKDISEWDVSNVTDMSFMFFRATSFNQNLSGWCVKNIPSEPENFSSSSSLIEEYKPVWGTCPTSP